MAKKAVSTALIVTMTAIVILVVAVVVLSIFAGGIQNIGTLINSWISGEHICDTACNTWKMTCDPEKTASIPMGQLPGCFDETYKETACNCPSKK